MGRGDNEALPINDILVKPFTQGQSGIEGSLLFPSDFVSVSLKLPSRNAVRNLVSGVEFAMGNIRIDNLATVVNPLILLEPTSEATALRNDILVMPGSPKAVDLHLTLDLIIDGGDSPWNMSDTIDFGIHINSVAFGGKLTALIETSKFLRLPIQHVFNINCWIAMIPSPEMDSDGSFVRDELVPLGLSSVSAILSGVGIDASCDDCSAGLGLLPEVLEIFESTGAVRLLGERLSAMTKTIIEGQNPFHTMIDRMLWQAPFSCPVSSKYDPDVVFADYPKMAVPSLSATDLDTLLFSTILAAEIGIIAIAENHRTFSYEPANPLELQQSVSSNSTFLDWTAIGTSLGLGSIGDRLFDTALKYIEGRDENGRLHINTLVKDYLLGDDGVLAVDFQDQAIKYDELTVSLKDVKVGGLDTFQSIAIAKPIGPQTISNEFVLQKLSVEVSLWVDDLSTEDPPKELSFSFGFDDLAFSLVLFVAVDADKIGDLELGSIVNTNDIFSCVMSAVHKLYIPNISLLSATFPKPQVRGLLIETDDVIAATLDRIHEDFGSRIEASLPVLLDTSLRSVLNSFAKNLLTEATCPDRASTGGNVDFRSMFGGASLYGNLPGLAKELFQSNFLSMDKTTGLAQLNTMLRSWTGSSTLSVNAYLIDVAVRRFRKIGIDMLKFAFGKLSIENFDTVKTPITIIEPNSSNGTLLDNRVSLGGEPDPIRITAEAVLDSKGDPALTSRNDLELSVEFSDVDIFAVILAKLGVDDFMSVRLRRLFNMNCWLALFHNEDGGRDLMIETLSLAVSSFRIRVKCLSQGTCSSGLSRADQFLRNITSESGLAGMLETVILDTIEEILQSDYFHSVLDSWIENSASACPESPTSPLTVRRKVAADVPEFSLDVLQKLTLLVIFGAEAGSIGLFESHAELSTEWDPLSAQQMLAINETELIDFTNFTDSIGDWANTLLDELR